MSNHCPFCHFPTQRRHNRTCGAIDCLSQWRSLTSTQRAAFMEMAEREFSAPIDDSPLPNNILNPKNKEKK